jgi:hypothetical protein
MQCAAAEAARTEDTFPRPLHKLTWPQPVNRMQQHAAFRRPGRGCEAADHLGAPSDAAEWRGVSVQGPRAMLSCARNKRERLGPRHGLAWPGPLETKSHRSSGGVIIRRDNRGRLEQRRTVSGVGKRNMCPGTAPSSHESPCRKARPSHSKFKTLLGSSVVQIAGAMEAPKRGKVPDFYLK